jgi:hypothetical protein
MWTWIVKSKLQQSLQHFWLSPPRILPSTSLPADGDHLA